MSSDKPLLYVRAACRRQTLCECVYAPKSSVADNQSYEGSAIA
ncbi:hypothetical protein [Nostoc sp.]